MKNSSTFFSNITKTPLLEQRAKNSFALSLCIAILLAILLTLTIIINQSITKDVVTVVTLAAGILIFGTSMWLSRRNRPELATAINIVSLSVMIVSRVFIQKGIALQVGVIYFVLISAMAIYTLPRKWVGRVIIFTFLVTIFTVIVDQYTEGVQVASQSEYITWLSILVGAIYLLVLATQFQNLSLRSKLIVGFLFLSITPLIVIGAQSYASTRKIVENQIKANILRSSLSTTAEFQAFLDSQFSATRTQARAAEIVEYMSLSQSQRKNSANQAAVYDKLDTFGKTKPSYIQSYALLDINGVDILDTDHSRINTSFAEQGFFVKVMASNNHYVSGLTILPNGDHVIYFAAPIAAKSEELAGVYMVTYNANIVQSTIDRMLRTNQLSPTTTEYTYIVDGADFFVIAHTVRVDLIYKTYLDINDARLEQLKKQGLRDEDVVPLPDVVTKLSQMEDTVDFQAPAYNGDLTQSAAVRLTHSSWIVVTSQPVSTISKIIQNQTRTNVIVSVIIIMLAALIAVIASNFFTSPIIQLTRVAENISAGNFTQKAEIRLNDEIGVLAHTFNTMTDQIQGLISNLENRVEQRTTDLGQRTADLEQATVQIEKRARQLETISEISRFISSEKDQEKLLPLITQTVSERFGFYHVGIFLIDENEKYAILRASNSPGGQVMLRRQHKLEIGQTGIVGNVTFSGRPRVALDTGADAIFFNNPDLPNTRSEMAVPLTARGKIIGALDVQSTISNAFADEDVSIISLLADQVAIAIDNVRLLEEAQNALAESQSIFTEYVATAWQKKTGSAVLGYHQTLTGGKVITANMVEEVEQDDNNVEDKSNTLAIPIQVREQVIGILNVRANTNGKAWNKDEVNIVQAVVERLGLALDNARLFEETSTRASRERLVSDITTKIRGTNDPQEMVKTAMEELQRALGATRIEIIPQKNTPTDK